MKSPSASSAPSRVAIVKCGAYEEASVDFAVNEAVELLGGWAKFIQFGASAHIKPNLAGPFSPERAVTTHPLVVKSVVKALKSRNVRPTIGDSPAGLASRSYLKLIYKRTGMESLSRDLDVPLDYTTEAREMPLPHGRVMKRFTLLKSLASAQHVVNLPKFKTHLFTRMTGAVKNLYGAVHGVMKMAYHSLHKDPEVFSGMLLDLARLLGPELTVADAVVGMEGDGPAWGKPRFVGYIMAGADPLAVDLVMCRMMGFSPGQVPLFRVTPPPLLEVVGIPLEEAFLTGFKKPRPTDVADGLDALRWIPEGWRDRFGKELIHRPTVREVVCTGCGRCVDSCPESAITLKRQKAVMDHHSCIRCWCCHEVCPSGAVELAQSLLGRLLAPLRK